MLVAEVQKKRVRLLNYDTRKKTFTDKGAIETLHPAVGVAFGPKGRIYVGTWGGVDVYDPAGEKRVAHWQSEYNPRGHQVWGLAVSEDGTMICSEGGNNEKRWYFALPEEFEAVEE